MSSVRDQVEVLDGRNNVIKEGLCLLRCGQEIGFSLKDEKGDFKTQAFCRAASLNSLLKQK